jgi:hypothetical protein
MRKQAVILVVLVAVASTVLADEDAGSRYAGSFGRWGKLMKGAQIVRVSDLFSYTSSTFRTTVGDLKRCGSTWVEIVPAWWQTDTGASAVVRHPGLTPSDGEVDSSIRIAHRQGLKVLLKPEVRCSTGVWIGLHDPHDAAWFQSYRLMVQRYALIAQQTGCELLSIGCALDATLDEPWEEDQWQTVIDAVRSEYLGKLGTLPTLRTSD